MQRYFAASKLRAASSARLWVMDRWWSVRGRRLSAPEFNATTRGSRGLAEPSGSASVRPKCAMPLTLPRFRSCAIKRMAGMSSGSITDRTCTVLRSRPVSAGAPPARCSMAGVCSALRDRSKGAGALWGGVVEPMFREGAIVPLCRSGAGDTDRGGGGAGLRGFIVPAPGDPRVGVSSGRVALRGADDVSWLGVVGGVLERDATPLSNDALATA